MASSADSSDEDSDLTLTPDSVTDYQFVDEDDGPISFAEIPYEAPPPDADDPCPAVYLRGTTEDRLQKVYQAVTAWKLEVSRKLGPEVFVLARRKWIKLLNPRKAYEGLIRSVLISTQALHFLRWSPNSGNKNLWDHLRRVFEKFEVRPSEDDFRPHITFMKEFAEKDSVLATSELLKNFLERKGGKRTGEGKLGVPEVKQPFIAKDDEVEEMGDTKGDESEEDDADLFDSVCTICDNGGDLLCCEGECMRSFHATEEAGEDSTCESLGLTSAQVKAIQNYLCENCKVKQHQCFACGKLGNSDKSKGAEVFQCSNATCGYFYHPKCVAKLLFPDDEAAPSECEKTVFEGRFACPYHKCVVCKKLEDKADPDLQFAVCRRCPKSYHRKCLPRKISFTADPENGMIRAWEDLLPNRILIYCLKHKIDEELMTPKRDHIVFPRTGTEQQKQNARSLEVQSHKQKPPPSKRREPDKRDTSPADRPPPKKRALLSIEVPLSKGRVVGHSDQLVKRKAVSLGKVKKLQENDLSREVGESASLKKMKNLRKDELSREEGSGAAVARSRSPSPRELAGSDLPSCSGMPRSSFPVIDATLENKMKELLEKESVTVNDVIKRLTIPRTHPHSGRHIEKITRGKIEGSVEAIRTAYRRIIDGGSVDDAKAVCEPEVVKQVAKWHKRLGAYLSPFLHGMRYTSFGRHFTKEEKLQEICGKLQWYVKTNDTIVDFCCGSNDFSRIMKEKMDALGKRCNFKNYDIVPPKDDFCYEQRDWMTVSPKELPNGDSLIMGLNPPFGTKGSLANKFIDKALTFNPKLVILIVPMETERLDEKRTQYDLVWADSVMLSGMSFYLPGSVDVNDKQTDQWNADPPFLYLWSRTDWTARHKAIAEEHAHFSNLSEDMPASPPPSEKEQQEAENIISQVVGDISVISNEVMEMEEDKTSKKGKGKVDPVSCELEGQAKTRPAVLNQEEKNAGAYTTEIEEVNKSNGRNEGGEKKGSLERTETPSEAQGANNQNEGRVGRGDQNSGASSPFKEARANKSRREYTDNRHHNEGGATRDHQEPRVPHDNFKESGVNRTEKLPEMREGGSYNNTRLPDTWDGKRRSPERTGVVNHKRSLSPTTGVLDSRSNKMRESEDRATCTTSENVADMDICPPNHNPSRYDSTSNRGNSTLQRDNKISRYNDTLNRGNSTLQRENSSSRLDGTSNRGNNSTLHRENSSRYESTSNRENGILQSEDNNTVGGDVLPLGEFQYINNAPLMEQLMDTRHLDSQLDFSDLDPILSNGNDLNDLGRLYHTPSSYHWPDASGLGSGSVLEGNRAPVPDYMDPRGYDDFEGLGRFYGPHDDNRRNNFGAGAGGQPASTFHNSASLPSYSLSGFGGGTSTSALDRYAPRLDETNYLQPGGPSAFSGGSHQYHHGLSGTPAYSYGMHRLDRRDNLGPHPNPYPPGFGPRQHSYRPPPGSGGWIDD